MVVSLIQLPLFLIDKTIDILLAFILWAIVKSLYLHYIYGPFSMLIGKAINKRDSEKETKEKWR